MLPPVLTDADQAILVDAAYTGRLCAVAMELGLNPAAIQRTRAEVPAFTAALDAADDWLAMQLAESLRAAALSESTDPKTRIPLAKELLRQRPPSGWMRAKRAGRQTPAGEARSNPTRAALTPTRPTQPTTPRRVFEPEPRLTAESLTASRSTDRTLTAGASTAGASSDGASSDPSTNKLRPDQLPDGQSVNDLTIDELIAWGDAHDPRRRRDVSPPPSTG